MAFVDQRAQHRHDGRDAASAGDEQDSSRPLLGQHEVAADTSQADHHAATGMLVEVGRDQATVVVTDRQLEVGAAFGVGGRVAASVPAAVDVDREVNVLTGLDGVGGGEGLVGSEREGDAARSGPAHVDDPGAGLTDRPGRRDQLGVAVNAVRTGKQVYQV